MTDLLIGIGLGFIVVGVGALIIWLQHRNKNTYMRSPEWKTKRNAHLVERRLKGQRIG